ncbi:MULTISPECIES: WS/DGAT/MGAT family O-acyltransferase [Rhodococcus]|uniref:Diacylglycerol O-acyltransferase n=1 Tax=Rhodococcus oxybenzonivorans TaxID=1990687 RepID=A0AAE4V0Y1_9NOCA|nr:MULTISPECIES: wax ester/triacylglycerol synthase family O-acyltransferase [Rhodococcus]MDV7244617.1 wax ester/triacylglycerol synthase family O-acyltransferase [Rhodococcus oxybenzonivorans]MDV7266485.1 wax ester/triacylglycerol synthase family O-acyltransferase [Rhodococcus oxybenzonivorans]MDV7275883.1 wax ester/triacylglycerol synthase family O-acyltransferase [Rhodococcus oxybenzonivorans]MDV7332661.1 wax ester/triacylglycerol synthase family O-acyltransferase [Rhodococcus oxybenzonivora
MVTRLTTQDASFYFLEASSTPMHVGSLAIFRKPRNGLSYEELLRLVEERLSLVPRYRQKVREVALGLSRPVWVDDQDFDIEYHVRRSALPKPGSDAQLHDLVARLTSRPLDNTRPLWEMYLVEGLSNNRFAIFTKSHSSLVDGETAPEIGQVILDSAKTRRPMAEELWMPSPEPSETTLVAGALADILARPGEGLASLRMTLSGMASAFGETVRAVGKLAAVVRTATQVAPATPLNATISRNRRFAVVKTELGDYRKIRARYGCEVNDVILAVVSGALRNWLLSRGEPVAESTTVRAMVPMSVYVDPDTDVDLGQRGEWSDPRSMVSSFLIDLPVGEPNAVVRLSHVAHAMEAHAKQSRRVTAQTLVRLSGFAPATLHAMSARAASSFSQRMFNLMITNAPGPQMPLYVGGARMLEMYPVSPLLKNQTLSIALTSYDGNVYYGLNADRDAMADVDVVAALLYQSLEELLDASR